jgi:hypothetical protein
VTHERPGGEVRPVELRSTPEVSNGLFMLCSQRVVVTLFPTSVGVNRSETREGNRTNKTTDLWTIFIEGKKVMGEPRQCQAVLCNIQDVGVDINVVNSTGVDLKNFFELLLCSGKI